MLIDIAGREEKRMGGPLAGVRICDMTHVILGPYATQQLADLGADVIKVEAPFGDSMRHVGPSRSPGMGPIFLHLNRNKRSLALDLKNEAAREGLLALLRSSDVFACNMRPKALERLGLDYASLKAINPRLIYVNMMGFSQRGPYADEPAYDDVIQAATALPTLMAGPQGDTPRYAPTPIADRAVGLYAMGVISAALFARERTGEGQAIDVPMFETMAQFVLGDHLYGETFVPAKGGFGYPRLTAAERRPYRTLDGYVCCLVYTDTHWRAFLAAFGEEALMETDPRLRDFASRTQNINALYGMVAEMIGRCTTAEVRERLAGEIAVFPMHTFETLIEDPHLRSTGFLSESDHPTEGRIRELAVPSEWSGGLDSNRRPAPRLGEHSREVLLEAGLAPDAVERLIDSGAARQA